MNCKSKRQMNSTISLALALTIFLFWGLNVAGQAKSNSADRHVMYGFEVPYPKKLSNKLPTGRLPFLAADRLVPVTLEINAKGRVSAVQSDEPADSLFVGYYRDKLRQIEFEPARVEGKNSPILMPLTLHFQPNRKLPDLYLPVDSNGTISDRGLYMSTLELNGVSLPSVISFPSYFCDLEWNDSLAVLPYVLLGLKLDEGGELIDIEIESTNYQAFALQLMSASLSAQFSPLYVNGQARGSSCFLLVSFFPQLTYPTEVWKGSSSADYSILRRHQIRLYPDTVGFLTKPLPRFFPPNDVTVSGRHSGHSDTVLAAVMISAEGDFRTIRYGKVSPSVRQGIQMLSKVIKFFPAMDYAGQPQDFHGVVRLIFSASAKIRIEYLW